MSAIYGIQSLLKDENPELLSFALSDEFMGLGVHLQSSNALISRNFASPFVSGFVTMPLQADYNLPPCYQVANIRPPRSRLQGFHDETLFYIFYSMPRDIIQEFVAEELMARKWRYHKIERAWLTRDESCPPPTPVEPRISERGVYFWWDTAEWKKIKRDFILRFSDFDSHLEPGGFMANMNFAQGR